MTGELDASLQLADVADALFEASSVGVAVFRRDLTVLRANPRLLPPGRMPAPELTLTDLLPGAGALVDPITHCAQTGQPVEGLRMWSATAAEPTVERCWHVSVSPLAGRGEPGLVACLLVDLTEASRSHEKLAQAAERLEFVAQSGARLAQCDEPADVLDTLVGMLVPAFVDACTIEFWEDTGGVRVVAAAPAGDGADAHGGDPDAHEVALPLPGRSRRRGVVRLVTGRSRGPVPRDDMEAVAEVVRWAATVLDRAELHARSREASLTLQRSLLPDLPSRVGDLELGGHYAPSSSADEVGGDWYDVVPLSSDRVAVVIGDVLGHSSSSAALMGQLRAAFRTLARLDLDPPRVLELLDAIVADSRGPAMATCLYAAYDPAAQTLDIVNAGHPAPLLLRGTAPSQLLVPPGTPLGVGEGAYQQITVQLRDGDVLAFFTDGLVEARDVPLDAGTAELSRTLQRVAADEDGRDLPERCRLVVEEMHRFGGFDDDTALLLVHVDSTERIGGCGLTLQLRPEPESVSLARNRVGDLLSRCPTSDPGAIVLVVSELVTNAVEHAGSDVTLRVRLGGDAAYVEVVDDVEQEPRRVPAGAHASSGRGLHVVSAVARRWGVRRLARGKVVWAELPLGPG